MRPGRCADCCGGYTCEALGGACLPQKPAAARTARRPTQGELFEKIEDAIKLAARLGDDAFDFIEGRGLAQDRREIFAELTRVYCELDRLEAMEGKP